MSIKIIFAILATFLSLTTFAQSNYERFEAAEFRAKRMTMLRMEAFEAREFRANNYKAVSKDSSIKKLKNFLKLSSPVSKGIALLSAASLGYAISEMDLFSNGKDEAVFNSDRNNIKEVEQKEKKSIVLSTTTKRE